MSILLTLFVCLTVAYFFSEACRLVRLPRVIGQIGTGIILGLPLIKERLLTPVSMDALSSIANIGFVLLLFFAGLETNFTSFMRNIKLGASISIFKTLIPFLLGFFISSLFGFNTTVSLIVGVVLSVSAAAVSIDVLEELNLLKTKFSSTLISVNAVNDVIEFFVIAIVLALGNLGKMKYGLYELFFEIALFIVLVIIFKSFIIPFILKTVEKEKSATSLFYGSIIIALLMATLSDVLGLGSLIGALLAGIIVRKILLSGKERRPWEEHSIAKMIHTITFGFFAPLFFVYVGLNANIYQNFNIPFSVMITLFALLGTLLGTIFGNFIIKGGYKEGALMGWGLGTKGDTDLIIAAIALQNGLINPAIFTAIVFMSLSTTVISAVIFRINVARECKFLKIC